MRLDPDLFLDQLMPTKQYGRHKSCLPPHTASEYSCQLFLSYRKLCYGKFCVRCTENNGRLLLLFGLLVEESADKFVQPIINVEKPGGQVLPYPVRSNYDFLKYRVYRYFSQWGKHQGGLGKTPA